MSHYFLTSSIFQLITVKFWAEFITWFYFCRWLKRTTFVFFAKWKKTSFVQWSNIYMKGLTPKEIKAELDNVHSTFAPAFAIVYNWVNEFKRGRTSTWCTTTCTATSEVIDKVHDIVLTDRRVKVRELVETIGISHGTVISILHEQLGMKKLSARWVPRLLTVDHKRDSVTISTFRDVST